MSVLDDLRRARDAYERRDWVRAYRALSDQDDADLSADDFRALADTAYLLGRRNDSVQALQRAYQAYLDHDDVPAAVRTAYALTATLWQSGEIAIGNGWLARAGRELDAHGEDVVERGYLLERHALGHIMRGELAEALEVAPRITDCGRRFSDPDLTAMGLHTEGRLRIYTGMVADGLRLLDEAMVAVLAGEVSAIFSGVIYCSAIEACQEVSDLGRAAEWTHALTTWCDAQPGLVAFTGQCAVHRGQLMRLHGAYDEAVVELTRAAERYAAAGGGPAVGLAHYERGEVLRLQGEYVAADAAFAAATEHGHPAQPGRARLWAEQGRGEAALAAVRRLLTEWQDPVHRSQALPAAVDILVASGELAEASGLATELAEIADAFDCSALRAASGHAAAGIALAGGEPETCLTRARTAGAEWSRLCAPYEAASCRLLVGRALRVLGDEESAAAELAAARAAFAQLGAAPAERAATRIIGEVSRPGGLSPREIEVLRLVAAGKTNTAIAADLALSHKTVARHLSNIFAKLDVGSRTAAAAFAHEHDLV